MLRGLAPPWLRDAVLLSRWHRAALGRQPRFWAPRSFNEWMLRRLLLAREDSHRAWNDKLAMRRRVAARVGEAHLVPLLAVADSPEALDWGALPEAFALKASHGSGLFALVPDRDAADCDALARLARAWLGLCYYAGDPSRGAGGSREWAYRGIPRRLMVEPLLPFGEGLASPLNLKAYVFDGRIAATLLEAWLPDGSKRMALCDADWQRLPVTINGRDSHGLARPPAPVRTRFAELARAIGQGSDFLRLDGYATRSGDVLIGEVSPCAHGGRAAFDPPGFDLWLGAVWRAARRGEAWPAMPRF
jgi:hypothetical protein